MGRESQELRISDDMVSKAVYPNEVNNQGQINHYKIWLRRLSSAVHLITKNHIKGSNYNSFYPHKDIFKYIHEVNGRRIVYDLNFLKLMMIVMKPQLVVDHHAKYKDLKLMTLAK